MGLVRLDGWKIGVRCHPRRKDGRNEHMRDMDALEPSEGAGPLAAEALLAHRETVFLVCLGFTRNRRDAEDLAQETYLRALRNLGRIANGASSKAWLCSIARNACRDHLRRARFSLGRRAASPNEPAVDADPHVALDRKEQREVLRRAIARLSRPLRDALVLREYGELSYEHIAQALGIELGTVMSRLHRARHAVLEEVQARGGHR